MPIQSKYGLTRLRVTQDDETFLEELAGDVLSKTDVASLVLRAGLQCIRKNHGQFPMPLSFAIAHEREADSAPKRKAA